MTSTSEEKEETQNKNKNEWKVIRRTKRKKIHRKQHNTTKQKQKSITDMNSLQMKQLRIPQKENQVKRKSINFLHYSYMVL